MGNDDANVGGPGECPGHEFEYESLVVVREPGRLFPGLGMGMVCKFCETPAYQASNLEQS